MHFAIRFKQLKNTFSALLGLAYSIATKKYDCSGNAIINTHLRGTPVVVVDGGEVVVLHVPRELR